jgi:hypothetical protein
MMRILTVRQPWAWAIIHAGKAVENRRWSTDYRGPVAIHAGLRFDHDWASAALDDAMRPARNTREVGRPRPWEVFGAIIGVVDLVDVHEFDGIECSPWAQSDACHLILENARPLREPIPFTGALGLRRLDETTEAAVLEAIA